MKKLLLLLLVPLLLLPAGPASSSGDELRFDPAVGCVDPPANQVGTKELRTWLYENYPMGRYLGIYNCRPSTGGNGWSLHAEGRAVDWGLDVTDQGARREAYDLVSALLADDFHLARAFGVQEIIYDCGIWDARNPTRWLTYYTPCDSTANRDNRHETHIHIGQNWQGARALTSYWAE